MRGAPERPRPADANAAAMFREVPRTGVIQVMAEARARGYRSGDPVWANLGQGAPETGPLAPSSARVEVIAAARDTHEYAPVAGLWSLREAIADLYNHRYRRGLRGRYSAENVVIAGGGRVMLARLLAALGPVNVGHLLPDYSAYEELLGLFRTFTPLPLRLCAEDGFRLDASALDEAVADAGLGALLFSNPCNPTGRLVADEALDAWVACARRRRCALIADESYAHYVYDRGEGATISAAAHVVDVDVDPVVILDGLTKNWRYPGLRLAWALGPRAVIERVAAAGSFLDGGAPHAIQRAAIPLVEPAVADAEARAIQRAFAPKRARMLAALEAMGIAVPCIPDGAFYCFADVSGLPPALASGGAFCRAALDARVICVPGRFFDVDPGKRRGHLPSPLRGLVRLSFGPCIDEVDAGLARLRALIEAARREEPCAATASAS